MPLLVLLAAFGLGVAGGFLYTHEPAPPELRTRLTAGRAEAESSVRGTLTSIGADHIEVTTAEGARRLSLAASVPIEELTPLTGAVAEGAAVNLGGNRTESGFVITGVVVIEGSGR